MIERLNRSVGVVALAGCWALGPLPLHAADVDFTNEHGIKIASEDENTFLRLGARLHVDAGSFDDDVTPLSDDVIARRARVHLSGRYHNDWRFALDYDFGEVDGFKNAWLRYSGFQRTHITFGNQVAPFSLEESTSSNNIMFLERSLMTAFSPGFLVGLSARAWGDKWSLTAGVFGDELDDRQRRKGNGTSVAGRLTYTPVRSGRGHLVHLGVAAEFRDLSDGIVRFRARPETFVTSTKLVDTGTIRDAEDLMTLGLEFAWRYQRLSVQGEYAMTTVSRKVGPDTDFSGGYVSAGFFLTNHRRGYRRSSGSFGRFAGGKTNAWQIAARYSTIDLNDQDIDGGKESNITVGLNWFINRNFALKLNYVDIDASPNRKGIDESPSVVQLRFQVAY